MLNNVFKRGCGWDPAKTGMKKIHQILSYYHEGNFPVDGLFNLYDNHLHHFFDDKNIKPECLDSLDQDYILYLIYGSIKSSIRAEDIDHVHPRTLLMKAKVGSLKISSIGNLQLIDYSTNRGEKNSKEFKDWVNEYVQDKQAYIARHLIPEDESLWTSDRFNGFLRARLRLIADKIKSQL